MTGTSGLLQMEPAATDAAAVGKGERRCMDATKTQSDAVVQQRRWFQYSLRSLLLFMLACSVACSWLCVQLQRSNTQRAAAEAILAYKGCRLFYDRQGTVNVTLQSPTIHADGTTTLTPTTFSYECGSDGFPWEWGANEPKSWVEQLFGEHFVRRIVRVDVTLERIDEIVPQLKELAHLRTVVVAPPNNDHKQELELAITKIERELPGVEVLGVEYDYNIGQTQAESSSDVTSAMIRCTRTVSEFAGRQVAPLAFLCWDLARTRLVFTQVGKQHKSP